MLFPVLFWSALLFYSFLRKLTNNDAELKVYVLKMWVNSWRTVAFLGGLLYFNVTAEVFFFLCGAVHFAEEYFLGSIG